jgi:hypothetical protein
MTVTSAPNRARYVANGATTAFPYGFRILAREDLRVSLTDAVTSVETVLVLDVGYDVSGVNNVLGGTVTMTVAPSAGTIVTILPAVPVEQPTDFRNQGSAFRAAQEKAYDRAAVIAGKHEEVLTRALTLHPAVAPGVSAVTPLPVGGKAIGWNAGGTALENITPPTGATGPKGDPGSIPIYATVAARNAAIPSPTDDTLVRVTATGAIYRASGGVWQVVYDQSRIIDVKSRGAGTNVAATDTPIILQAFADALADPLKPLAVYFPTGNYALSQTVALTAVRGLLVYGDGSYASKITWWGTGGTGTCVFRFEDCQYCAFHDLYHEFGATVETVYQFYNNAARSGNTPTNNHFHNISIEGGNGTTIKYGFMFRFMPQITAAGTMSAAVGIASFTSPANQIANGTEVQYAGVGTVTVAGGVGAATFSTSQAGKIENGSYLVINDVYYPVSAFNGTTGCTLSGAPNMTGASFRYTFDVEVTAGPTYKLFRHNAWGTLNAVTVPALTAFTFASGADNNNDLHSFNQCTVANYEKAGWYIGHSQSKAHHFYGCQFQGNGLGENGIFQVNGSFRWFGGGGGGNNKPSAASTAADFYLSSPMDNLWIEGGDFENSARLLKTSAGSGGTMKVTIKGTRWACDGLSTGAGLANGDNIVVDYSWYGSLDVTSCQMGNGGQPVPKFKVKPGGVFRFSDNTIDAYNSATATLFDWSGGSDLYGGDISIERNALVDGAGLGINGNTIQDGQTTPYVHYGYRYRTRNSAATRIRDFLDPHPEQQITILFDDVNTTVQSGGAIQLKDGLDWVTPARGSSLVLRYNAAIGVWNEVSRGTYTAPSDITALVTAIEGAVGGSAGCVYGIYDARYNVNRDATVVYGWTDARGIEYGGISWVPFNATHRPSWDNTNKYLVFDGNVTTGGQLKNAPLAVTIPFTGSMGIAFVGEVDAATAQFMVGISRNVSGRVLLRMDSGTAANTVAAYADNYTVSSGNLATGGAAIKALYIARRTQTAGNTVLAISKDNGAETASASTANASVAGSDQLTVAGDPLLGSGGTSTPGKSKARAIILLTVEPTAAIRTVIRSWSNAQHGTA